MKPQSGRGGPAVLHVTAPGGVKVADSLGHGRSLLLFVGAVARYCPIPHGKYSSTWTNKAKGVQWSHFA